MIFEEVLVRLNKKDIELMFKKANKIAATCKANNICYYLNDVFQSQRV